MKPDLLTAPQLSMLVATFRCVRFAETRGQPAVFGVGPQWRPIRALCRLGLLEYWTTGRDIDGDQPGDVDLYRPTDDGVRLLIELGEISESDFRPAVVYALSGVLP